MLSVNNIDVYYEKMQALSNVSLKLNEKETIAVLGSNGAGKTTMLKTISGIIRPEKGNIYLGNTQLNKIPPYKIISNGISHVPESRRLFGQMTVEENLIMGAFEKSLWKKRKEKLNYVFDLFNILKERRSQKANTLSGGEQQMVAIGRALMSNPEILMLDEPSLGLAPKIVEQIFELIQNLKEDGIRILLVEQNVNIALEVSDYAYVLENGEITLEGKAKELQNNKYVKEAYLGI